jgi:hypothetical protein
MNWSARLARLGQVVDGQFAETAEHRPMSAGSIAGEQSDPRRPVRPVTGIFSRQVTPAMPKDRRVTGRDDTFGATALAGEAVFTLAEAQLLAGEPRKGDRLIRSDGSVWRISEVRADSPQFLLFLQSQP